MEIELQKALFSRLSLNSYKVNDGWFEGDLLPLITIGEIQIEAGQVKTNEDWQLFVTIHTWSKQQSSLQVKQMNEFVRLQLDDVEIADYRVSSRLIRTLSMKEKQEDGSLIHHGVTQYRFRILKEEI